MPEAIPAVERARLASGAALVMCGAFDSTGAARRGALEMLDQVVSWGQKRSADKIAGQGSIFDLAADGPGQPIGEGV